MNLPPSPIANARSKCTVTSTVTSTDTSTVTPAGRRLNGEDARDPTNTFLSNPGQLHTVLMHQQAAV